LKRERDGAEGIIKFGWRHGLVSRDESALTSRLPTYSLYKASLSRFLLL